MRFESTIPQLRQQYTKPWQQRLFDWCEANGIIDVDAYRAGTNEWALAWPPELDASDSVVRNIHLYEVYGRFEAYSGIFTGQNVPAPEARLGPLYEFEGSELEDALTSLREYSDGLTEVHLIAVERARDDYLMENRSPTIIRSYVGDTTDESDV